MHLAGSWVQIGLKPWWKIPALNPSTFRSHITSTMLKVCEASDSQHSYQPCPSLETRPKIWDYMSPKARLSFFHWGWGCCWIFFCPGFHFGCRVGITTLRWRVTIRALWARPKAFVTMPLPSLGWSELVTAPFFGTDFGREILLKLSQIKCAEIVTAQALPLSGIDGIE